MVRYRERDTQPRRKLDRAVRERFELSWDRARAAIQTGKVRVDGVVVTDAGLVVRDGASIEYAPNAPRPHVKERRAVEDTAILHEDHAVVVVNKPAGISTVPFGDEDPNAAKRTLDALLREILGKRAKSQGAAAGRAPLGVVHRLDKDTSGVMVFTRTLEAKKHLAQQFRAHTVERTYVALAHGIMTRALDAKSWLLEDRGDGLRGSAKGTKKGGQLAITHVRPLEQLGRATLVECKLETGRTHQIRIHLSEAGHPIVGERVYIREFLARASQRDAEGGRGQPSIVRAPRMMLHARELGFEHPTTGELVRFEAEPPPDFAAVLAELRGSGVTPR